MLWACRCQPHPDRTPSPTPCGIACAGSPAWPRTSHDEGQAQLLRARVRLARAASRAQMADDLADQLAELRAVRARAAAARG